MYKGKVGIIYSGVKNCIEQRACHTSVFVYDDECLIKHKDSVKSAHADYRGVVLRRRHGERAAAGSYSQRPFQVWVNIEMVVDCYNECNIEYTT